MGAQPRDWLAGPGKPASHPHWTAERTFRRGDAPEVRRFAQAFGSLAGLRGGQLPDFVLAVNEAAACATARRPGTVRVRLCAAAARVYCEVRGDAPIMGSTVMGSTVMGGTAGAWETRGERHGEEEALRRRMLRLVCDYVRVTSGPEVTRVMLTMAVRRAARDPSSQAGMRRPR